MRVLNLYAGIGGNRRLWEDVDVTAVEMNPDIAAIYQDFFPSDKVIVGDAHQYLLEHFKEFDFIWSSPPCPTHSRMRTLVTAQGADVVYPCMSLYQEILLLKHWFKGKYCVENVISYYEPLIKPVESNSHYFWTNFHMTPWKNEKRGIRGKDQDWRHDKMGFDLSGFKIPIALKKKIIANCVEPEVALHILNESKRDIQSELFR